MKEIDYSAAALHGLRRMSRADAEDMIAAIEAVAAGEAEVEPLRGPLADAFKLRLGEHRAVLTVSEDRIWVAVIAHRSAAYKSGP